MATVSIRLPDDVEENINLRAQQLNISKSEFMRNAIEKEIALPVKKPHPMILYHKLMDEVKAKNAYFGDPEMNGKDHSAILKKMFAEGDRRK